MNAEEMFRICQTLPCPEARCGDIIVCQSGHLVCEVVDDHALVAWPLRLGNWRQSHIDPAAPTDCACGAVWWSKVSGDLRFSPVLNVEGKGWVGFGAAATTTPGNA